MLLLSQLTFFKINFSKKFRNTNRVSHSLNSDQDPLGPNCFAKINQISKIFICKIVNIFASIRLNMFCVLKSTVLLAEK